MADRFDPVHFFLLVWVIIFAILCIVLVIILNDNIDIDILAEEMCKKNNGIVASVDYINLGFGSIHNIKIYCLDNNDLMRVI